MLPIKGKVLSRAIVFEQLCKVFLPIAIIMQISTSLLHFHTMIILCKKEMKNVKLRG